MVDNKDFDDLCGLVIDLAEHVRRISIGTQGLHVDSQVEDIKNRVETLRERVSAQ